MYRFGDIILAHVQFTDTFEIKVRPALVLFQEYGNIVVAGITSNLEMKGIQLTKKEGASKESVIKLNYLFTIAELAVKKHLFTINNSKKQQVREELIMKLK